MAQWQPWQPPIIWSPSFDQAWTSPRPLDQGFEDIGPAGASLRSVQIDPRSPVGFEQVYRTPDGSLMRQDGGIRAIFPRSVYQVGADGLIPEIPAGTIFHIGADDPSGLAQQLDGSPQSSNGIDLRLERRVSATRIDGRRDESTVQNRREPERPPATLFSSESYRRARLATLLAKAGDAG